MSPGRLAVAAAMASFALESSPDNCIRVFTTSTGFVNRVANWQLRPPNRNFFASALINDDNAEGDDG